MQSGLPYTWWPWAVTHHCAARNIQVVTGDSPYNRRHRQGHCRAHQIPFGALIYFAPIPRTGVPGKPPFKPKNVLGLFLGYEFHPGGLFAGRYRMLEWEQLRIQPQLVPRRSAIQFVDTVFPSTKKEWYFPLGRARQTASRRAYGRNLERRFGRT